jgi:hypothetical protein
VLSPSTLLLSHYHCTLQVLTHTAPPVSSGAADSKLDGPVGVLRPLSEAATGHYATGIAVDMEARRIFVGKSSYKSVAVHDADSGIRLAEVVKQSEQTGWCGAADVALIDGVLVTADRVNVCIFWQSTPVRG